GAGLGRAAPAGGEGGGVGGARGRPGRGGRGGRRGLGGAPGVGGGWGGPGGGPPCRWRYTRVPQGGLMDRRLADLADRLAAGLMARREFLRKAAVITGGTAAGLGVLNTMAHAQGPKLRVWLFKSYVTAGNDI